VFEPRFQVKNAFADRKNMAFSTGTITYKTNPEFLEVYTDSCDQPSRKQIKDNPEFLAGCVDCYSSDYMEDADLLRLSDRDNALVAFCKRVYNRFHTGQQKKYYSFNMVDKFNEYKMCIVGEEILGVPGIGFVEGMACGCAYIGLDSPMYTDLGLYPGVHYIGYDGSLEDLKAKIQYYQAPEHQEELERIAATGCAYVRENFNGNTAAENLLKQLKEQQAIWKAKKEEAEWKM
jgi:glycosyltransferase involved in cell wall biosynthesis